MWICEYSKGLHVSLCLHTHIWYTHRQWKENILTVLTFDTGIFRVFTVMNGPSLWELTLGYMSFWPSAGNFVKKYWRQWTRTIPCVRYVNCIFPKNSIVLHLFPIFGFLDFRLNKINTSTNLFCLSGSHFIIKNDVLTHKNCIFFQLFHWF